MLDQKIIQEIERFVSEQPRSIQEIATHINKNWRTADRYIEEIIREYGSIGKKTFREGTRGALKIIFFAGIERAKNSIFQEELEKKIFARTRRGSIDPFDMYQHIDEDKREVRMKGGEEENDVGGIDEFEKFLMKAEKQVLFFSGNLSFLNFDDGKTKLFRGIEKLAKKGISMKVVCRIDMDGKENIEKLLALNKKYGKELVEIHHANQPLRATIVDNKGMNLKGIKKPTGRKYELDKKIFFFYTIYDENWVNWITRIFWKMYNAGIGSKKRLEEVEKLEKLKI